MEIKANVLVVSADGKHVGHVHRVVLNPRNGEVKDLVVRHGHLFNDDRVVPLGLVSEATGEQIRLSKTAAELEKLDVFEETHYVPANGEGPDLPASALAPAYYWYPPLVGFGPATFSGAMAPELMGFQLRKERHIPSDTVPLKEGAAVKGSDGHTVGKLEEVLTAAGGDQATHIVVGVGLLQTTRKVIPIDWIKNIDEDEVRLAVSSEIVEKLPVFER